MNSSAAVPLAERSRRLAFFYDVAAVGGRAIRSVRRDPEALIPALVIPIFFFVVNVGALQDFAESIPGIDYKAFQLPVAIIFAVTGMSRALVVVSDIQSGYFDRLSLTPVNRLALLLGLMVADMGMVITLSLPVLALAFVVGVSFETGILGILAFVGIAGVWAVAYSGFPYAIAFRTGNQAAVNTSFLLFFPFVFLTTVFLPKEALTGWMSTMATYNPVTYLLEALRSLVSGGWNGAAIARGLASIAGVGAVSLTLALLALKGRVSRG